MKIPLAGNACLLLLTLAGAALLVWWAIAFHPSNEQLWMVPAGLIIMCTPMIVWFSVLASDATRRLELFLRPHDTSSPQDSEKCSSNPLITTGMILLLQASVYFILDERNLRLHSNE